MLGFVEAIYVNNFEKFEAIKKTEEIADISIGKTPPRSKHECFSNNSNDVKWVSISDLGKCGTYIYDSTEKLTNEAIKNYNVKIVPKDTVILSFKLTVGRVAITNEEMATNEAIAHFNLKDKRLKYYLYCFFKNYNYENLGNTSSIAIAINSKIIKGMPINIPFNNDLDKFNKIVEPIFEKIRNNELQNQKLSQLRDTLLQKLMNGEIDLDKIEI